MQDFLQKPLVLKVLLGGIMLLYVYSLVGRAPHVDDAWLGDHAYWLSKTGVAKSELMRGITLQEEKIVVHHKFHAYLGAAVISLFGFSLTALKSISLVSFLGFIFVFYRYTYKKMLSPPIFFLALGILFANALIFNLSFVYRPEILVMTLGFIAYIFLQKSLAGKKHIFPLIVAGLSAGLAVSTHLNGIIFIVAGLGLLLWNRQLYGSLLFGFSTLPTISIYFIDMLSVADMQLWYYQISNSPSVETLNQQSTVVQLFMRIIDEQMRFFHSPMEISFTVLFLLTFIPAFRYMKKYRNLLRYTLLLAVALMLVSVHKSSKYIILYMPYLILIISLSLQHILNPDSSPDLIPKKNNRQIITRILSIVLVGYLSVQLVYDSNIAVNKFDDQNTRDISNKYIGEQTDTLNIIAPMTSVFNEIEHFNRIQGEICYNEMKKSDPSIYKTGFLEKAEEFDIDYIILSEFFITHFGVDQMNDEEIFAANYEMLLRSEEMMILKNLN